MAKARVKTFRSTEWRKRTEKKKEERVQIRDYKHIQAKIDAQNREAIKRAQDLREKKRASKQPARPSSGGRQPPTAKRPPKKSRATLRIPSYLKPVEVEKKEKLTLKNFPRVICSQLRKRWRWLQGYYPARGGPPQQPPPPYTPPPTEIKDTEWKRNLNAAMDVRIIRYPEPFSEFLLTSNLLEPKNYKIMVNNQVLYYSYDYTPYMLNISHYVEPFSQLVLDPQDNVALHIESCKYPTEFICCTACLDCRKCRIHFTDNVCYIRAPNGHLFGRVVRRRRGRLLYTMTGYDIFDANDKRILKIRKQFFLCTKQFTLATGDKTSKNVATIQRRLVPDSKEQLIPNHYDYRIMFEVNQDSSEIKFLVIATCFLIDYMLDVDYRPFIRYGSRVTPTYRARFRQ